MTLAELKDYQPLITAGATIFAALVAAGVAITVGRNQIQIARAQKDIADEQRRIASEKLRLDLLDRRLSVFDELRSTLANVENQPHKGIEEIFKSFSETISRARFLFPRTMASYLDDLHMASLHIKAIEYKMRISGAAHIDFAKWVSEKEAASTKLESLSMNLNDRFAPFLSFGHVSLTDDRVPKTWFGWPRKKLQWTPRKN